MQFVKEENDVRGNRWIFHDKDSIISLFEIKKGFSRGGQYHENAVTHMLISGNVKYTKENIVTKQEHTTILNPFSVMVLPPNTSDLITALEDSMMIGLYKKESADRFYKKHRKIVRAKIET